MATQSVKLIVVGDGTVGKTCLLLSYTSDSFPEDYVPTVFENIMTDVTINKEVVKVQLWDTAGQEEYNKLRILSYPKTDVLVVCFDLTNEVTFQNLEKHWYPELSRYCPDTPTIIVGTKYDLIKDKDIGDFKKKVEAYAYKKDTEVFYTSAKENFNIKELFNTAIIRALDSKKRVNQKKKKKCRIL